MRRRNGFLGVLALAIVACGGEDAKDDADSADGSTGDGAADGSAGDGSDGSAGDGSDGSAGDGSDGSAGDGSPGENEGVTRAALIGTWLSGCRQDAANYYGQNELVLTDTTYTVHYRQYLGDPGCSDPAKQVNDSTSVYSSWSLGAATSQGVTELDAVAQTQEVTLLDDATASAWTAGSGCGPFSADQTKDVSGLTCYGYTYPAQGGTAYSIFFLEAGELFAGDGRTADGLTPETRPSVLDTGEGRTYMKQ